MQKLLDNHGKGTNDMIDAMLKEELTLYASVDELIQAMSVFPHLFFPCGEEAEGTNKSGHHDGRTVSC